MGRLFGHGTSFGLGIIKKLEDQKGFIVLPRRWVIERSFGWLVKQRRLTRDHEKNPRHHEAFVHLAFIGIMTQRLTAYGRSNLLPDSSQQFDCRLGHGLASCRNETNT